MFPSVVADSDQLSLLSKVLNDFCSAHEISEAFDRENVAHRLMQIFGQGAQTEDALHAGLRAEASDAIAA